MRPALTETGYFALRKVADDPAQNLTLRLNEYGGYGFAVDLQSRSAGGRVAATGGVAFDRFEIADCTADECARVGGTPRYWFHERVELIASADHISTLQVETSPRYFPRRGIAPPRVPRRSFIVQPWVEIEREASNIDIIASVDTKIVDVSVGLFRS